MSVAVATAVQFEDTFGAEDRQVALCRSVLNNRLYFDDGKRRNQWQHCREFLYTVFMTLYLLAKRII